MKIGLVKGNEEKLLDSWRRLLRQLKVENNLIKSSKSSVIPEVEYKDLRAGCERLKPEIQKRGAVVVRGVIPEAEARAYKEEVEDYVAKNPHTKGQSTWGGND